jgi:hypothetical protein
MDYFLQNSMILIENQHIIRTPLLNMIANMTIIDVPDEISFGFRCMSLIKELLRNKNPEIEKSLDEILRNIILPFLKKNNVLEVPINIFNGCSQILSDKENHLVFFINSEIVNYAVSWIDQVTKKIFLKVF